MDLQGEDTPVSLTQCEEELLLFAQRQEDDLLSLCSSEEAKSDNYTHRS